MFRSISGYTIEVGKREKFVRYSGFGKKMQKSGKMKIASNALAVSGFLIFGLYDVMRADNIALTAENYSSGHDSKNDAVIVLQNASVPDSEIYFESDGAYLRRLIGVSGTTINFGQSGTSLIQKLRFYSGSNGSIEMYSDNNVNTMTIENSRVGIGDVDPQTRLSLDGFSPAAGTSVWGSNDTISFHNGSLGDNGSYGLWLKWNMYRDAGSGNQRYLDYSDRPNAAQVFLYEGGIRFDTAVHEGYLGDLLSVSTRMFIRNDGNIGVGTETPDHKLDVNGTVRAKEVIVETNWSDFVFEEDYELRSLQEVADHIETHGHLPDVPSAAIVQAEGLSVAASQAIMMQKIEELTLYILKQQKELEQQRSEIELLKSRL